MTHKPATKLKEEGNNLFKISKFHEAIECYTEGIALTSRDVHFFYSNRSASYLAIKDFDSAIKDARKCIEINPSWFKVKFFYFLKFKSKIIKKLNSSLI